MAPPLQTSIISVQFEQTNKQQNINKNIIINDKNKKPIMISTQIIIVLFSLALVFTYAIPIGPTTICKFH